MNTTTLSAAGQPQSWMQKAGAMVPETIEAAT